jgi:hypothetical protein
VDRSEAETLEFRGALAPFLKKRVLEKTMQQSPVTTDADIVEVRAVTGAAACNQLLAEGWVLLGVYPITAVAEMTRREANGEQKKQDIQRYVRRFVGYALGMRRE